MQCVILAAGRGTRMGVLTKSTPKPLLKIGDKTILEHNLSELPDEVEEVIVVIGYKGEMIKELIGDSFVIHTSSVPPHKGERRELKITYIKQKELKGTADAVFQCRDLLNDRFLVLSGDDIYYKGDLEMLIKQPLAILVWPLPGGADNSILQGGVVKVNEARELADIVERGSAGGGALINTSAYVLNKDLFQYPLVSAGSPANEYGLPQTFLQMVKDGRNFSVVKATHWKKISVPQDLELDN